MTKAEADERMHRVNPTADACYMCQGPGVGADATAHSMMRKVAHRMINKDDTVLDVGFGGAGFLDTVVQNAGKKRAFGVDIAAAAIEEGKSRFAKGALFQLDVSHQLLPFEDDKFTLVMCTEAIEHMSNPYHMVAEVKRVLQPGGLFVLSFPMPEDNLGYDCGQHAHVYPGFLVRDSFERFMRQLYFKQIGREQNGSSAWYAFANYKGEGIVDVFEIVSGNYTEERLFAKMDEWDYLQ